MPAATRRSVTVLTPAQVRPAAIGGGRADHSSAQPEQLSGLIVPIHLDANGRAGAVISIPASTVVNVPGHGRMQIWSALTTGGPFLIKTMEHLTDIRISDYSVLDWGGVRDVVGALGGIDVDVPYPVTDQGVYFHPGTNLLTSASVLAYARQLEVNQVTRTELQSNLMRAILQKIADDRLLGHLSTGYRVLRAMARAFSADSSLAARLWRAIRHDRVAACARRYLFTVTPGAPG
jgi:LCP family protein required for cell wall assembly